MGLFGGDHAAAGAHTEYFGLDKEKHHEGHITHDLLGGAIAFEAAKAYEKHVAENGKPSSHAKAKEIFAGLAGALLTHEFETKGLNFIDRKRAEKHIEEQADAALASQF